jgi:hypothetical protein
LLDWLALEFQSNGWRVKPLVNQIMMSAVYRQASHRQPGDKRRRSNGRSAVVIQ